MRATPNRRYQRYALSLMQVVLPSPCLSCEGPTSDWCPHLGLCVACRGQLTRPTSTCHTCAEPLAGSSIPAGYRCGRCRERPPAFDRLVAPYLYREPLDAVIQHLKYNRLAYLGRHLARAIATEAGGELAAGELVTAVPLHWRRHLARGFNQAHAIARPLADLLGIEVRRTLRRSRSTRPQAGLSRDHRRTNPTGAFRPRTGSRLDGRTVLLVDDVATTGATLGAAAESLKSIGAGRVIAVVAGRTPPPTFDRANKAQGTVGRVLETPPL
jgi:ComF family protein